MQTSPIPDVSKEYTTLWQSDGTLGDAVPSQAVPGHRRTGRYLNVATTVSDLLGRCASALAPSRIQRIIYSDERLKLCYLGDGRQLAYVRALIFPEGCSRVEQSRVSILRLKKHLQRTQAADILVTDFDFPLAMTVLRGQRGSPAWIKQKILLPASWDDYLAQMRRKTRREAQRVIRKHSLSARVVPGREFAEDFYFSLYKPYIQRRHGEQAIVMPFRQVLRALKSSEIIQLLYEGRVIAAAQLNPGGEALGIGWTGMAAECEEPALRGAADTLDFFSIRYAIARGCSTLDMGHSRPHLKDGILRYKKKWGANIELGKVPQSQINLRAIQASEDILELLAATPMVQQHGKRTAVTAVLASAHSLEDCRRLAQDLHVPGLHAMTLFIPAAIDATAAQELRESLAVPAQVIRYNTAADLLRLMWPNDHD